MTDPLADLLADMSRALVRGNALPTFHAEAEWLRANRDRVLEALGGESTSDDLIESDEYGGEWWFGGPGKWQHAYVSPTHSVVSGRCECGGDPGCVALAAVKAAAAVFVRREPPAE
jgi:hypothetical protein